MTGSPPASSPTSSARLSRKQARTRNRLVTAASELIAGAGVEAVTIAAITERADLGFGTFYNYFDSRDDIIAAVVAAEVDTLGQRIRALTQHLADPAEVTSFSWRHVIDAGVSNPHLGWLLVRLSDDGNRLLDRLGPEADQDLRAGMAAGRWSVPDIDLVAAMSFSAGLAAIRHYLLHPGSPEPGSEYAELILRMLGLPQGEAHELSRRALPPLPSLEEAQRLLQDAAPRTGEEAPAAGPAAGSDAEVPPPAQARLKAAEQRAARALQELEAVQRELREVRDLL